MHKGLWQNRSSLSRNPAMRLALLGGGTLARLVLDQPARGGLPGIEVVAPAALEQLGAAARHGT